MGRRVNSARGIPGPMPDWERAEIRGKVFALLNEGLDDLEVARRSGIASRTVKRWREAAGVGNFYERRWK